MMCIVLWNSKILTITAPNNKININKNRTTTTATINNNNADNVASLTTGQLIVRSWSREYFPKCIGQSGTHVWSNTPVLLLDQCVKYSTGKNSSNLVLPFWDCWWFICFYVQRKSKYSSVFACESPWFVSLTPPTENIRDPNPTPPSKTKSSFKPLSSRSLGYVLHMSAQHVWNHQPPYYT